MKQFGGTPLYRTNMEIMQISNIIKQIESEKKQCYLSVHCSDDSFYNSIFSVGEWEEFKKSKNSKNVGILSVMVCFE